MCDIENLIDLTSCDDTIKDETVLEDAQIGASHFKEPYDPFDSIAKEACIKGEHFQNDLKQAKASNGVDVLIDLDPNETPPPVMETSDANSSQRSGNESRHRSLLQLAKLNAAKLSGINTPTQNKPSDFSFADSCMMCENLQMIAAESPIKLIEDEPVPFPIAEKSPSTDDACSSPEFEARLKKLRIALKDLPSKTVSLAAEEGSAAPAAAPPAASTVSPATTTTATLAPANTDWETTPTITSLSTAPRTVNVRNPTQAINVGEVARLVKELKTLVVEHVEQTKRNQFDVVIDALCAVVHCSQDVVSPSDKESPIVYTRQGTFDLDLMRKAEANNNVPADIMTCSSSTYDAESVEKPNKETDFGQLPANLAPGKSDAFVTEVVNENLALQLNELFGRHNLSKLQFNGHPQQHQESDSNQPPAGGQTVILVLNSAGSNPLPNSIVPPPSTARAVQTVIKNNNENAMRRRSSSLSIHDKAKQERPKSLAKQSSGDSTCASSTNMPLKELSNAGDKFNAMSSFRQRRNSFSIGSTAGASAAAAAAQGRGHLLGRTKVTAISESAMKPGATAKANIPVKRVVPMVKPALSAADVSSINLSTARCNIQDTPITSKGKAGTKLFCTSTPMPQMRPLQRRSLKPVSSYAGSCGPPGSMRAASSSRKTAQ